MPRTSDELKLHEVPELWTRMKLPDAMVSCVDVELGMNNLFEVLRTQRSRSMAVTSGSVPTQFPVRTSAPEKVFDVKMQLSRGPTVEPVGLRPKAFCRPTMSQGDRTSGHPSQ